MADAKKKKNSRHDTNESSFAKKEQSTSPASALRRTTGKLHASRRQYQYSNRTQPPAFVERTTSTLPSEDHRTLHPSWPSSSLLHPIRIVSLRAPRSAAEPRRQTIQRPRFISRPFSSSHPSSTSMTPASANLQYPTPWCLAHPTSACVGNSSIVHHQ